MMDVRQRLDRVEPDYREAATLGQEAIPHLEQLVNDPALGPSAVCLASFIGGNQATALLLAATSHPSYAIRFQAASGARNLDAQHAVETLLAAMDDIDPGVRRAAIRSVEVLKRSSTIPDMVMMKVSSVSASDSDQRTREAARELLGAP
jgi:HEAT repeat protein